MKPGHFWLPRSSKLPKGNACRLVSHWRPSAPSIKGTGYDHAFVPVHVQALRQVVLTSHAVRIFQVQAVDENKMFIVWYTCCMCLNHSYTVIHYIYWVRPYIVTVSWQISVLSDFLRTKNHVFWRSLSWCFPSCKSLGFVYLRAKVSCCVLFFFVQEL